MDSVQAPSYVIAEAPSLQFYVITKDRVCKIKSTQVS